MLSQQRLALAIGMVLCLAVSSPASADPIVIEDHPLSTADAPPPPPPVPVDNTPPPAAAVAPATPASNATWQLYQQVQQLQDQVQQLQGTVEEQNHTIEKLRSDDKSRYSDLDQRLNTLSDKLSQQQAAPAAMATSTAPAAASAPSPSGNIDEEKKAYLGAYDVFRTQGPDQAIPPMLAFVGRYPNSIFTPNAYYWLGEFYLAASPANLAEAKRQFEAVLSKYPDSPKAPAALYKLGTIADMQNHTADARKLMQQVLTQFPSSHEAVLAQTYLNPPADPPKPARKKKATNS